LNGPWGIAVDAAGNLYFADSFNGVIRKVSNGVITTVAGNGHWGFAGDNGPATSAELNEPMGVALDSAGNLYIAEWGNNRIRKVSNGVITTVAGNGTRGYGGDNGPATGAPLNYPAGVAMDSAGDLYIADTYNNRIRRVSNGVITTVVGSGTQGYSGDTGPATSAKLYAPSDVLVDAAGDLYLTDGGNNVIRKVSNGVITTVAGNGTQGYSGDNGPATSAELHEPVGVAVDSAGNLYIADMLNNRLRKVSTGVITTVAGNAFPKYSGDNGPAASAELLGPYGVAVGPAGDLYISDTGNNVIRKVSNGVITTVAGSGTPGYSGDNGPATGARLSTPLGIALDSGGNLYIADEGNSVVRKVSNGVIATVAGNGTWGYSGDNGPAAQAQLAGPNGVAVDSVGNVYIADYGNSRIRKVSNGVITTVAGNGAKLYYGDGGPATSAALFEPAGVAVDSVGALYIADYGNYSIREVSNGVITTVAGNGLFCGYIAYYDTCLHSAANGAATIVSLSAPTGVAADSAGNLYIADEGNSVVRKVSNGIMTTVAGNWAAGFSGDGGPATSAQLAGSAGVALDSAGNMYVADSGNNRIRLLTPSGVPCTATVSPLAFSPAAAGGNLSVAIQTASSCPWSVTGLPAWITVSGSASRIGPASVTLAVAANSGAARAATLSIAGVSVQVNQAAAACTYALGAGSQSFTVAGGAGSVGVTAQGWCSWTASSAVSWVTVTGGASSTGNGTATYQVAANAGVARSGNLNIAGLPYVVQQSGVSCSATVSPTVFSPAAAGGILSVTIQTGSSCPWSVTGLPNWITVSGAASGPGPASVTLIVAANPGAVRAATVSIAGASLQVNQAAAACTYALSAGSQSFTVAGGAVSVGVTAPGWCSWTSSSAVAWVTVTGGASGTGNGAAAYQVAANAGMARSGNLTIAGLPFVVQQSGVSCSATVSPTAFSPAAAGGNLGVAIQTGSSCGWAVMGLPSWISVSGSASGTGPGSVTLAVAANPGAARTATVSVGGVSVAVTQAAAALWIGAVANAASNLTGAISPGEIVVLYGSGIGPAQLVTAAPGDNGSNGVQVANTSVSFNGIAAPMIYASGSQTAAIVPYGVTGTSAQVAVTYQGQVSAALPVPMASSAPGIFTYDSTGAGPAAAINQDGVTLNTAATPTKIGDIISIYATGEGQTTPAGVDGTPASVPYPYPNLPVTATVGGLDAPVKYAGGAPGEVAGLMQVNVQIPAGIGTGNAVAVVLRVGNVFSRGSVTIAVH
jgi:uncharacterized protein (TIGR03437 family)